MFSPLGISPLPSHSGQHRMRSRTRAHNLA
jgi:hypothetical protein